MSDLPERIFVDPKRRDIDWFTINHLRESNPDGVVIRYAETEEYIRASKYAELEASIEAHKRVLEETERKFHNALSERNKYLDKYAEMKEQNKRLSDFIGSLSPIRINGKFVLPVSEARWNVFLQKALKEKDDE